MCGKLQLIWPINFIGVEAKNMKSVIIYPTDTVWGIGCDIFDENACRLVHLAKNSDPNKPMSILFENIELFQDYVYDLGFDLNSLWRFGLTILCPLNKLKKEIPKWVICDSSHVGLRVLTNPSVKKIYQHIKKPIISTSLNKSGDPVINQFSDVKKFFISLPPNIQDNTEIINPAQIDAITGSASTIIMLSENIDSIKVIREGANFRKIIDEIKLPPT